MSKEIWLMICWFTCWRKSEFYAYRWTNTLLFYHLSPAFFRACWFCNDSSDQLRSCFVSCYEETQLLKLPPPLSAYEYSIVRGKFIPRDTQSSFRSPAIQADGFPWWPAQSLNLNSARQRTKGEIFKDKGRSYQTPWICLGLNSHWCFSKASPTAGLFSMAQDGTAYKSCLGEFQIRERITVIIIIEYSESIYLI